MWTWVLPGGNVAVEAYCFRRVWAFSWSIVVVVALAFLNHLEMNDLTRAGRGEPGAPSEGPRRPGRPLLPPGTQCLGSLSCAGSGSMCGLRPPWGRGSWLCRSGRASECSPQSGNSLPQQRRPRAGRAPSGGRAGGLGTWKGSGSTPGVSSQGWKNLAQLQAKPHCQSVWMAALLGKENHSCLLSLGTQWPIHPVALGTSFI